MKSLLSIIALLITAACLWSCTRPAPADECADFKTISEPGWLYGDTIRFTPSPAPADSIGLARIALAVRHTDAYMYSNVWLELSTPVSGTDSMRIDTVNIPLADVYGHWYGRGIGVSYVAINTLPDTLEYDLSRPAAIRHIMRVDTLCDIEQIGLIMQPVYSPDDFQIADTDTATVTITDDIMI